MLSVRPDHSDHRPARLSIVRFLSLVVAGIVLLATGLGWYGEIAKASLWHGPFPDTLQTLAIRAGLEDVVIGREALKQNDVPGAASLNHLRLHEVGGEMRVSNVSTRRKLEVGYSDGVSYNTDRVFLTPGMRVFPSRASSDYLEVKAIEDRTIRFEIRSADHQSEYELVTNLGQVEFRALSDSAPLASGCSGGINSWRDLFHDLRARIRDGGSVQVMLLGGGATCVSGGTAAVAMGGGIVPFGAVRLLYIDNRGFAAATGTEPSAYAVIPSSGFAGSRVERLAEASHPLALVTEGKTVKLRSVVIGRTHYDVGLGEPGAQFVATLTPTRNMHRVERCERPPADSPFERRCISAGTATDIWRAQLATIIASAKTPLVGLLYAFVVIALHVFSRLSGRAGRSEEDSLTRLPAIGLAAVSVTIAVGMVALEILHRAGVDVDWSLFRVPGDDALAQARGTPASPMLTIVAWCTACAAAMLAPPARTLTLGFMVVLTMLIAQGNIAMAKLGFASPDLRFMGFYDDSAAVIVAAATIVAISAITPTAALRRTGAWIIPNGVHVSGSLSVRLWRNLAANTGTAVLGLMLAFVLFLWLAFGVEEGLGGVVQPSELIKTLLAINMAALIVSFQRNDLGLRDRIGRRQVLAQFGVIATALLVILLVPFANSDQSPLLIMVLMVLLSLVFMVVLHYVAVVLDRSRLAMRFGQGAPVLSRASRPSWHWRNRGMRMVWGLSRRWMDVTALVLVPAIIVLASWQFNHAVQNPQRTAAIFEENMSGVLRTPMLRLRSWIELYPAAPLDTAGPIAIDYPDTDAQVLASRRLIAQAVCNGFPALREETGTRPSDLVPAWAGAVHPIVRAVEERIAMWLTALSQPMCPLGTPEDAEESRRIGLRISQIHNDFASSWLFAAESRDGVLSTLFVQAAIFVTMLLMAARGATRAAGTEEQRSVATLAGYATAAFAILFALHWGISFLNALGSIAVMGQPSTFISAGRSHFLFVGIAGVLAALISDRLTNEPFTGMRFGPPRLPLRTIFLRS